VEALFQTGSARTFVNHYCVTPGGGPFTAGCPDPTKAFGPSKLDSDTFYPRVLVGGRTMFSDESQLSIEYYYQSDGSSALDVEDAVRGLILAKRAQEMGLVGGGAEGGGTSGALPLRFTFDPLRRHYLIASYSKPKIHDDWTVSLVLIAGLRDLSGMISPTIS